MKAETVWMESGHLGLTILLRDFEFSGAQLPSFVKGAGVDDWNRPVQV